MQKSLFRKGLVFGILPFLLLSGVQMRGVLSEDIENSFNIVDTLESFESHTIENVTYVSQETDLYCAYASFTMIFKYYEVNTSLREVLFVTGAGHSMAYPYPRYRFASNKTVDIRFPVPGFRLSRETNFACELYGLSYNNWSASRSEMSPAEKWNQYWLRVKQNITNDIPVVTAANPFGLISFRRIIKEVIDVPDKVLDLIPSSHAIVIVGFNESNQTVCINDPAAAVFGYPEYGIYAWMDLTNFSKAVENGVFYPVKTFKKISDPETREIVFERAHQRNIQRMMGNISSYDYDWGFGNVAEKFNGVLGIKALESLKKEFQPGFRHRYFTMRYYKLNGIVQHFIRRVCERLLPESIPESYYEMGMDSISNGVQYKRILSDKQLVSQFLWNNTDLSPNVSYEAVLFDRELENWTKLWEDYSKFADRGLLMSKLCGLLIIKDMDEILGNIISIEQEIVDNTT